MRFLADESCDFAVIHALRASGHDVIAVSEVTPRAEDSEVIRLAVREKRILLTEAVISFLKFASSVLMDLTLAHLVFPFHEQIFPIVLR